MGREEIERADLLSHVMGLLDESEDASVRDHIAGCDECRGALGEYMVLGERLRALGKATLVRGRERFADRTVSEGVKAIGGHASSRTTAWRGATGTLDSQRLRRIELRRRMALVGVLKTTALVLILIAAAVAGFWFLRGPHIVDCYGAPVEKMLKVDLAEWGLRPTREIVAGLAGAADSREKMKAVAGPVERLLSRELALPACRIRAVVLLEFAATVARAGNPAHAPLLAALVAEAAGQAGQTATIPPDELAVFRKVHEAWRRLPAARTGGPAAGTRVSGVTEPLVLLIVDEEPLALYFAAAVEADSGRWQESAGRMALAAKAIPELHVEIAWRWLEAGARARAREALAAAPAGRLMEAAAALVQ